MKLPISMSDNSSFIMYKVGPMMPFSSLTYCMPCTQQVKDTLLFFLISHLATSIQFRQSIVDNDVAVVQQVVCWLIRRKARVRAPGQASKQNTKCISSAISSHQISGKNSESKQKIAMKSFPKNLSFRVDFKLQVPQLMYKININNISGVRNQVNNPD